MFLWGPCLTGKPFIVQAYVVNRNNQLRTMVFVLIVIGIGLLVYGIAIVFGFIKTDISKDSRADKIVFSERSRYLIARYNAGIGFIVSGLAITLLGAAILLSN
jgi:hypothetical protein